MDPSLDRIAGFSAAGSSPLPLGRDVTATDVAQRRLLFGIDDDTLVLLAEAAPLVRAEVDAIVAAFYERQLAIPSIAAKIADAQVLARLRAHQRRYVLDLFAGRCDRGYILDRLQIGRTHERLRIDPQHYLAALRLLRELILRHLQPHLRDEPARLTAVTLALDRLLAFDSSLVMDTYIETLMAEVEAANQRLHRANEDLETRIAERTRELEEQARRDPLTGLYNARALREHLGRSLSHARRRGRPLTLVYFDVDDFKKVNDTRGHSAGDEVLRTLGAILREICRREDVPCRYGGDEFCIVVVDADLARGEALCRRICERYATAFPDGSLSLGLAQTGPGTYDAVDELIDRADRKMYEAKREPGFQIRS